MLAEEPPSPEAEAYSESVLNFCFPLAGKRHYQHLWRHIAILAGGLYADTLFLGEKKSPTLEP